MTNLTNNNVAAAEITEGKGTKCIICEILPIFNNSCSVGIGTEPIKPTRVPFEFKNIRLQLRDHPLEDTILIIGYTIFYLITFVYCLVSVLSGSGLFNRRGRGTNPESFKQKVLTVNESVSQRNRTGISEDRFLTNYR